MINKGSDHRPTGWQVIALSSEVVQDHPIGRRHSTKEYVLFRDNNGNICALEDRCAHRRAPLSLGRITKQGNILCPYHGWTYEGQKGHCIEIPNLSDTEAIPQYKIQSFITLEQHGLVFLWQGAAEKGVNELPITPELDVNSVAGEGCGLITLGYPSFVNTLLDSPALLLKVDEVTIIDDHLMGEPSFDGRLLTVERAADWTRKAKKRTRIPSDLPLTLRIQFDVKLSVASIEFFDEHNTLLIKALTGISNTSPSVTTTFWRWSKPIVNKDSFSKSDYLAYQKIDFQIAAQVDPSSLLTVYPYVSSILHGAIEPINSHYHN